MASYEGGELPQLGELGGHFADLSKMLGRNGTGVADPGRVLRFAVGAIPHAEHGAFTLVRNRRHPSTIAATGQLPRDVDALQYAAAEGPCLDATERVDMTYVDDLGVDPRWPQFGSRCVSETGIHSMVSVHLVLGGQDHAAMNLYAASPGAFDELDMGMASIFAPFAGLSVQAAVHDRDAANFKTALSSSRQIGTAIGILMARQGITAEQAFDQLRVASNHLNRRLRDLAAEVEYTGKLPGRAGPRRPSSQGAGDPSPGQGSLSSGGSA